MKNFKGTSGKFKIKHSESKSAFNVVNTTLGNRYKVASFPYPFDPRLSKEINEAEKTEAYANAVLFVNALENLETLQSISDDIEKAQNEIELSDMVTYKHCAIKQLIENSTKIWIMHADFKGALAQIDTSYKFFEHNGKKLTKDQVKKILEYAVSKGYKTTKELSDKEIDNIIYPTIIRQIIFSTVSDLVSDFVFYDRKKDEDLSSDQLNKAINDKVITVDEII